MEPLQRGARIAGRPDSPGTRGPPCDNTGNVLYSKSRGRRGFRLWRVCRHPKQGFRVFPHPGPVRGILFLYQASACHSEPEPAGSGSFFIIVHSPGSVNLWRKAAPCSGNKKGPFPAGKGPETGRETAYPFEGWVNERAASRAGGPVCRPYGGQRTALGNSGRPQGSPLRLFCG